MLLICLHVMLQHVRHKSVYINNMKEGQFSVMLH